MGCNWSCVRGALDEQQVADTVVRPDSPHQVLALTGTFVDGGSYSQVFAEHRRRRDVGAARRAPRPDRRRHDHRRRRQRPDAHLRLGHARLRGGADGFSAGLTDARRDMGRRGPFPAVSRTTSAGGETSIFIGAVDPTDASRVYLRSSASVRRRRVAPLRDDRRGQDLHGAQGLRRRGRGDRRLWASSSASPSRPTGPKILRRHEGERPVEREAQRHDLHPGQRQRSACSASATRQTAKGPELWACGNEYSGPPGNPGNFIVGRSTDDGATFDALMPTLTSLKGIAQCGAPASGAYACGTDAGNTAAECTCDEYVSGAPSWRSTTRASVAARRGCRRPTREPRRRRWVDRRHRWGRRRRHARRGQGHRHQHVVLVRRVGAAGARAPGGSRRSPCAPPARARAAATCRGQERRLTRVPRISRRSPDQGRQIESVTKSVIEPDVALM